MGQSIIRTVYLYLFAVLGLVLLTIGGVRIVDMALKQFVFTRAEDEQRLYARQPPAPPVRPEFRERVEDPASLTPEETARLREWLGEYEQWSASTGEIDPVAARRARDVSSSIALIAIGLPLYVFHWRLIRRLHGSTRESGQG